MHVPTAHATTTTTMHHRRDTTFRFPSNRRPTPISSSRPPSSPQQKLLPWIPSQTLLTPTCTTKQYPLTSVVHEHPPHCHTCRDCVRGEVSTVTIPADVAIDFPSGFPTDIIATSTSRLRALLSASYTHQSRGPIEPHLHGNATTSSTTGSARSTSGEAHRSALTSTTHRSHEASVERARAATRRRAADYQSHPSERTHTTVTTDVPAVATSVRVVVDTLPMKGALVVKTLTSNESCVYLSTHPQLALHIVRTHMSISSLQPSPCESCVRISLQSSLFVRPSQLHATFGKQLS
jgi:hypothetical protein